MRFDSGSSEVTVGGHRWAILRPHRVRREQAAQLVHPLDVALLASTWCDDANALAAMIDLYEDLTGSVMRPPSKADVEHEILPALLRAFRDGELVVLSQPLLDEPLRRHDRPIAKKERDPPPTAKAVRIGRVIKETTFLDVTVIDHEGNRLAGRRFKLQLPSGRAEEGRLDASARLFRANVDPGSGRLFILPDDEPGFAAEDIAPPDDDPGREPNFVVRIVDEIGEPVAGVEVIFEHGGASDRATTDSEGKAGIADPAAAEAIVRFADPDVLRETLRERWETIREGDILEPSDGVIVVELRGDVEPFAVPSDRPATISIQPYVARARLLGGYFDTSKCFLLPAGLDGARGVADMYADNRNAKLLIVGHTDTTGSAEYNDRLSLERADALKDFLTGNVAGWLKWYDPNSIPAEKRWGSKEDQAMAAALRTAAGESDGAEPPVRWFRRTRGIAPVKDTADRATRKALIAEYMALDATSLPDGIDITTHGCGESFPADPTPDRVADPDNRRVEVFFFDGVLGVQPPPTGKTSGPGSKEYPEWVKRARRTADHQIPPEDGGFFWSTTLVASASDVNLVASSPRGDELARYPTNAAIVGPGSIRTFDLAELADRGIIHLELRDSEGALAPEIVVDLRSLQSALGSDDARGASRVAMNGELASVSTLGDSAATALADAQAQMAETAAAGHGAAPAPDSAIT